ncbi:TPA: hypothetical protein JAV88_001144 [Raoultella ornithinolytica]|nr:hypothetical protein [Raoultella ornithinolytica]
MKIEFKNNQLFDRYYYKSNFKTIRRETELEDHGRNNNANFEMTGILLGQEVRKRKTPRESIAIIQQTKKQGMNI